MATPGRALAGTHRIPEPRVEAPKESTDKSLKEKLASALSDLQLAAATAIGAKIDTCTAGLKSKLGDAASGAASSAGSAATSYINPTNGAILHALTAAGYFVTAAHGQSLAQKFFEAGNALTSAYLTYSLYKNQNFIPAIATATATGFVNATAHGQPRAQKLFGAGNALTSAYLTYSNIQNKNFIPAIATTITTLLPYALANGTSSIVKGSSKALSLSEQLFTFVSKLNLPEAQKNALLGHVSPLLQAVSSVKNHVPKEIALGAIASVVTAYLIKYAKEKVVSGLAGTPARAPAPASSSRTAAFLKKALIATTALGALAGLKQASPVLSTLAKSGAQALLKNEGVIAKQASALLTNRLTKNAASALMLVPVLNQIWKGFQAAQQEGARLKAEAKAKADAAAKAALAVSPPLSASVAAPAAGSPSAPSPRAVLDEFNTAIHKLDTDQLPELAFRELAALKVRTSTPDAMNQEVLTKLIDLASKDKAELLDKIRLANAEALKENGGAGSSQHLTDQIVHFALKAQLVAKNCAGLTQAQKSGNADRLRRIDDGIRGAEMFNRINELLHSNEAFLRGIKPLYDKLAQRDKELFKIALRSLTLDQSSINMLIKGRANTCTDALRQTMQQHCKNTIEATVSALERDFNDISRGTLTGDFQVAALTQSLTQKKEAEARVEAALIARSKKDSDTVKGIVQKYKKIAKTDMFKYVHTEIRREQRKDATGNVVMHPGTTTPIEDDVLYAVQCLEGANGAQETIDERLSNKTPMASESKAPFKKEVIEELAKYPNDLHHQVANTLEPGSKYLGLKYASIDDTVRSLGTRELDALHPSEEFVTTLQGSGEITQGAFDIPEPDADGYRVGKRDDHEITGAILLKIGSHVQSKLVRQYLSQETKNMSFESLDGIIGFLDYLHNHRVTRLQSQLERSPDAIPSFVVDRNYSNHAIGVSEIRDSIIGQMAEKQASKQTLEALQQKQASGTPASRLEARAQRDVVVKALTDLQKALPKLGYSDSRSSRALRASFDQLKANVDDLAQKLQRAQTPEEVFTLLNTPQMMVRPDPRADSSVTEQITPLELLHRSLYSLKFPLTNQHTRVEFVAKNEPVTTMFGSKTGEEVISGFTTAIDSCLGSIDGAYRTFLQNTECNVTLKDAAFHLSALVTAQTKGKIYARANFFRNHFETQKIKKWYQL